MLYKLIKDWENAEGKILKKGNLKRVKDPVELKNLMEEGFIANPDKPMKAKKAKVKPDEADNNLNTDK